MSAFIPTLRSAFLYLSRQKQLRHWMETSSLAHKLTERFIAGLRLEDAIRVASELQRAGMLSSSTILGRMLSSSKRPFRRAPSISQLCEPFIHCRELYRRSSRHWVSISPSRPASITPARLWL